MEWLNTVAWFWALRTDANFVRPFSCILKCLQYHLLAHLGSPWGIVQESPWHDSRLLFHLSSVTFLLITLNVLQCAISITTCSANFVEKCSMQKATPFSDLFCVKIVYQLLSMWNKPCLFCILFINNHTNLHVFWGFFLDFLLFFYKLFYPFPLLTSPSLLTGSTLQHQ